MTESAEPIWIFGYGSLIARPGFEPAETRPATVDGWTRRFWQRSHDHRGTPDAPGRVVTLVALPGARCDGLLHRLPKTGRQEILAALDHRERDGYERVLVPVRPPDGRSWPGDAAAPATALTWVAPVGNRSWAGDAPVELIAAVIAGAAGDSGTNLDYLLELDQRLTALGIDDRHVRALVARLGG